MAAPKIKQRTGATGLSYLRVSSRGQVETELDPEGMSLPAQRRKCLDKARKSGLTIVDELVDSGITATTIDQRASYQELIERVRTDSSISFVMVYALSRLHRNWAEAGVMVMQLRNYGVRLLSATENLDDSTPEGQMMLGVIFAVSGFQSAAGSKDLQYKMTQKAVIGGTPGFI
jgi:site-specific DNA recombinase